MRAPVGPSSLTYALFTLAVVLTLSASTGLHVETSGILSPASPQPPVSSAPHRETLFEQLFLITSGDRVEDKSVSSIVTSACCQIYVSFVATEPPGRLATVRVVGSSEQLRPHSASVRTPQGTPGQLHISTSSGRILRIEIQIHDPAEFERLTHTGSGDVIVESAELFDHSLSAALVIELISSGNVYFPPAASLVAQSLQIRSSGSGSVFGSATDVSVSNMTVNLSGSGDATIAVARTLHVTGSVAITVQGSGRFQLSAPLDFHAPQLLIQVSGSGDAAIRSNGGIDNTLLPSEPSSIARCQFTCSGSGELTADGVGCSSASAVASGSGDVVVQVHESLLYHVSGSGTIYYAGAAPRTIVSTTGRIEKGEVVPWQVESRPSESSWMREGYDSLPPRATPRNVKHQIRGIMATEGGLQGNKDAENNDQDEGSTKEDNATVPRATTGSRSDSNQHRDGFQLVLLLLVVVLVSATLRSCVRAWLRRTYRTDREREPLLSRDAPVYI